MKSNEEIIKDLGIKFDHGLTSMSKHELMSVLNMVRIDTMKVAGTFEIDTHHFAISHTFAHGRRGRYTAGYFFGIDQYNIEVYSLDPTKALIFTSLFEAEKYANDLELEDFHVVEVFPDGSTKPVKKPIDGNDY